MSRCIGYSVLGLLGILVIISFVAGYRVFGGISGLFYVLPLFVIPVVLDTLSRKPETVFSVLLSGFLAFQIGLRRESVMLMYALWPVFMLLLVWLMHLNKTALIRLIHIVQRLFHAVGIFTVGILVCSYLFIGSSVNTLWNDTVGTGRYDNLGYGFVLDVSKYSPPCTKLLTLEGLQLCDLSTYVSTSLVNIANGQEINREYLAPWTKSGELSEYIMVDETIALVDVIQEAKRAGVEPTVNSDIVMNKLHSSMRRIVPIGIGEFLGVLYLGYIALGLVCYISYILLQPLLYRIKYRKMKWLF